MKKNVNPILALVIVIIFGSLLFLKFYFYQKALDVPRVSYIKKSPAKDIVIKLGYQLYSYSNAGKLQEIVDLRQIGYSDGMKDFDFFSNGDILINRDDFLPTFSERLNRYFRKANTKTETAKLGKGLQRCNLVSLVCHSFNQKIPAIQGSHFLYINRENDDVYLADTGRHEIRKFDSSGKLLAEMKEGLQFPNQIFLENNKLWIVDTNNHVMKAIRSESEVFGELIEEHEIKLEEPWKDPWIWPSSFSKVGNNWWVHVARSNMSNAKIFIYDKRWKKTKTLKAQSNSDFVVSQVLDKSILISDTDNFLLHQYDFNGNRITDFALNESGQGIQQALKSNKKQDQKYRFWSDLITWLGIVIFACLFAYAIAKAIIDYRKNKAEQKEFDEIMSDPEHRAALLAALPVDGEWVEARKKFKYLKWNIWLLAVSSGILAIYAFYVASYNSLNLIITLGLLVAMLLIASIATIKMSRFKIGFYSNQVILKTHTGKMLSEAYENIKWNERGFLINNWYVLLGSRKNHIFPFDRFEERLIPYLNENNKLGRIEALKLQWKSPEGSLKYACMAVITAVILFAHI